MTPRRSKCSTRVQKNAKDRVAPVVGEVQSYIDGWPPSVVAQAPHTRSSIKVLYRVVDVRDLSNRLWEFSRPISRGSPVWRNHISSRYIYIYTVVKKVIITIKIMSVCIQVIIKFLQFTPTGSVNNDNNCRYNEKNFLKIHLVIVCFYDIPTTFLPWTVKI